MFRNLFRPDSPLMITMSRITDCIFLSLFWILCCMPVVTMGAAFAALYDGCYYAFRKGSRHSWQRFFHTFRGSWKQGILPTLVLGGLVTGLGWAMIKIWNAAVYGQLSWAVFAGAALAAVVLFGMVSLVFPMLSRFENSTGALLKNSLLLSLANLPRTLLLGVINALAVFACVNWVFPLFFLPGLAALLGSFCLEPMFRPYMPEEEELE